MDENMRMWTEVLFNVGYLIVVWGLVVAMLRRLPHINPANQRTGKLFITAFGLLALGDTGHVGFRVLAYMQGNLEATVNLFGSEVGLVGLGALSTAITVTFFYMVMIYIWAARYDKPLGMFGYGLLAVGVIRLLIMIPAQNEWNNVVPPQDWSLVRNIPLMILGLGAAYLILRDAFAQDDRPFKWVGISILVSYGFYMPVILFVQQAPMVGMLMIPKTLAYVAIAVIAYQHLFRGESTEQTPVPHAA